MSDDEIERRVRLVYLKEQQRQRDRWWSRAQTIAVWIGALATLASPWIIVLLAK